VLFGAVKNLVQELVKGKILEKCFMSILILQQNLCVVWCYEELGARTG
jgi:hypothetical protein